MGAFFVGLASLMPMGRPAMSLSASRSGFFILSDH